MHTYKKLMTFIFFYEYKIRKYFLRKWSAINIFDNVLMEKVIKYKVFAKTYVLYKSLSQLKIKNHVHTLLDILIVE